VVVLPAYTGGQWKGDKDSNKYNTHFLKKLVVISAGEVASRKESRREEVSRQQQHRLQLNSRIQDRAKHVRLVRFDYTPVQYHFVHYVMCFL